jgi:hypothetical protein
MTIRTALRDETLDPSSGALSAVGDTEQTRSMSVFVCMI